MSQAEPKGQLLRQTHYQAQNGTHRLTGPQMRRCQKKINHVTGERAGRRVKAARGWRGATVDTSADAAAQPPQRVLQAMVAAPIRWSDTALGGLKLRKQQLRARTRRG